MLLEQLQRTCTTPTDVAYSSPTLHMHIVGSESTVASALQTWGVTHHVAQNNSEWDVTKMLDIVQNGERMKVHSVH